MPFPQLRHVALLYGLVLALCVNTCVVAIIHTHAWFYLPEAPPQQKFEPVLQQLEALGVFEFQTADNEASWAKLSTDSASFDLVWSFTASPLFAEIKLPHQFNAKVNHLPGADQLTSPDALRQHLTLQQKKHAKFYFDFMPAHYELPRDLAQLTRAYTEVRKKSDASPKRRHDPDVHRRFLLSERAANGNEDSATRAEVFVTDEDLQFKLQSSAFKGKSVVVDQYVEPLLLDSHKFRVGFYVAVTSINPLRVYVYDHPLIQIAKAEYPSKLKVETDPAAYNFDHYIPSWDFPDLQTDFQELPSAAREGTNAWHILKRYLQRQGIDTKRLQDNVDATIAKVVVSSRGNFQSEQAKVKRAAAREREESIPSDLSDSFFELWKFIFEFDNMGKPWLVRVVSNPSMEATQSVLATDKAIKKQLLYDLINLVGVHPQARLPFEKYLRPADANFCSDKCHDTNRAWDPSCWSCPGWFAPNVARKLFAASLEYARRGSFNLVFPSLEQKLSKFSDTELSEYDIAFDRYLNSLSRGYSNLEDFPASDRAVVCVYREHCSNHGDCVNGLCSCDNEYEGQTCYIPKDFGQEEPIQQKTEDTTAQDVGTWKEKVENLVWNRGDASDGLKRPISGAGDVSASSLLLLFVLLGVLVFVVYRVFVSRGYNSSNDRPHDGKAIIALFYTFSTKMVATSLVMPITFLGLLNENVSLATVEVATYLSVFLLMLHVHSSGKRNATMLVAAMIQVLIIELIFYSTDRWHAQALVMLVSERLPLYAVLLQAQIYYITFVVTSRLRIDPCVQPFVMGLLMVMLLFPFELLGTKFLWWTWHDTDPLLAERLMGVPCHALFYNYIFASSFLCAHYFLRSTWLASDTYEEKHWKAEWGYTLMMPLITTTFAIGFLILGYYATVHLMGIQAQVSFFMLIGFSLLLVWMAERERDSPDVQRSLDPVDTYDSDWLYSCIDHAVNQMVFLLYFVLVLLAMFINPTEIVSLGHHQALGDCLENESFYSLVGMKHHRKKYLCVHDFDEEFNLCNYPVTQLLYEDSWYMICGRGYGNFATYMALIVGSFVGINLLMFQVLKRPQFTRAVSFHRQ